MELSLEYPKGQFLLVKEIPQFKTLYERIMQVTDGDISAINNAKPGEVYVVCQNYNQKPLALPEKGIEKKLAIVEAIELLNKQAIVDFKDNPEQDKELIEIAEKALDWVRCAKERGSVTDFYRR